MPAEILKFDEFELDLGRYELRRHGRPLKLEKVPMELLILLAEREGQLVTREEIIQRLWGDNVYVDTRQGINTAVRKIRLALQDDPDQPRILETVIGKGYRLAAPVRATGGNAAAAPAAAPNVSPEVSAAGQHPPSSANPGAMRPPLARRLFLLIQFGYLVFYAAAFIWFTSIWRLGLPRIVPWAALAVALVGAAVRIYLMSAVGFGYPQVGRLFRQVFPGLVVLDALWAASPLLLFAKLGYLSLLCVAALAFLPFSQRTLMMWAYGNPGPVSISQEAAR